MRTKPPTMSIRARSIRRMRPTRPTYIDHRLSKRAIGVAARTVSAMSPATLLDARSTILAVVKHGIGRLDLVENRFRRHEVARHVRDAGRWHHSTPARIAGLRAITLDRGAAHLKDELMPKYAELIYNGFWFSPEREMLQLMIDKSQELVTGMVRVKLYKGSATVVGRSSPYSLYDQELVTFEEGAVAYDHRDAAGFIKLNALRLRTLAKRNAKMKG